MNRCVGVHRLTRAYITAATAALVFALCIPAATQSTTFCWPDHSFRLRRTPTTRTPPTHPATPCRVANGVRRLQLSSCARRDAQLVQPESGHAGAREGAHRRQPGWIPDTTWITDRSGADCRGRVVKTHLSQNVLQAYASYLAAANGRAQFDLGKFVTPAGIERIDPAANWNAPGVCYSLWRFRATTSPASGLHAERHPYGDEPVLQRLE